MPGFTQHRVSLYPNELARNEHRRGRGASGEPRPIPAVAGLRPLVHALAPANDKLSDECRKLLDALEKRCPGIVRPEPVPPGQPGPEITLDTKQVVALFAAAARSSAGADRILWDDGENRLLVHASDVRTEIDDGVIVVRIPVQCDQVKKAEVQVAFAVGSAKQPAGMIAATEARPRGPAEVVDIWRESLIAFAWQTVLRATTVLSAESGTDQDGAGLIPLALTASRNELSVRTLARHEFDRVKR
jgi:hypothetical protein